MKTMAEDTTVRDDLARDRTALANERTLLAYGRTAVSLIAVALVSFQFAPTPSGTVVGIIALISAAGILSWGIHTYRSVSAKLTTGARHNSNPLRGFDADD